MNKVDFIFVSPDGFIHEAIGGVVKFFTNSQYSHAAIGIELPFLGFENPVLVEMLGLGIQIQDYAKYDNEKVFQKFPLYFSDENYLEAQKLVGSYVASKVKYGLFTDCVGGGLTDFFGKEAGEWWDEKVADRFPQSMDCSELSVRVGRIQYPSLCADLDANLVTPERLLRDVSKIYADLMR